MIGFSWVQARVQAIVAVAGLFVFGIVILVTRPDIATTNQYLVSNYANFRTLLGILVVAVPGILGIFLGAPLVARELESGTFRLAWTQSVSRTRWLVSKLMIGGLLSTAVAGLVSLMVTWWASGLDRATLASIYSTFDQRDLVPVGFAAFAFALGVTAGVLFRRTLPAMASVVAVFIAVRVAVNEWVRPHIFGPLHQIYALTGSTFIGYGSNSANGASNLIPGPPGLSNAWISSVEIVDKSGHVLTPQDTLAACPWLVQAGSGGGGGGVTRAPGPAASSFQDCGLKLASRFHELVVYLPASRYWPLQWSEFAIYLAAAVVLCGVCVLVVRSRFT
jgi:ABC-2 family transporter protein